VGRTTCGFSNGADPLFEAYKEHVGPFHLTPLEIFSKTFPSIRAEADQLTVISWILPQTEGTKSDNRKEILYPSERWVRSRMSGEEVNTKLRKHVIAFFEKSGYAAVAPLLSPHWGKKL
jgi:epoxyqueuosine reductase